MKIPTNESEQCFSLHLPNCWNAIQSAIYQIRQDNSEQAITFLKSAQESLGYFKHEPAERSSKTVFNQVIKNDERIPADSQRAISKSQLLWSYRLEAKSGYYIKASCEEEATSHARDVSHDTAGFTSELWKPDYPAEEPDLDDLLPDWADYHPNESDYWIAEYPEAQPGLAPEEFY